MTYESRLTGTSRFARIVLVGRHNVVLVGRNIMAAIWDKHVKTVTFTVTFSECSRGGALRFEGEVEGSVPGHYLKWSKKNGNPYFFFKLPPEAPAEGTPTVEDLLKKIAELEAAKAKPKPRTKPKA